MKSHIINIIAFSAIFSYFIPTSINVGQAKETEKEASIQYIKTKKEIGSYLGSISRGQQAYFLEKNKFTTKIEDLGLGENFGNNIKNYQLQLFTDKKAKKSAIVVFSPQKSGKTYISLVRISKNSVGEKITLVQLCESSSSKNIIPKLPKKELKGSKVNCPLDFKEYKVSDVEEAAYKQAEFEKELKETALAFNILQQQYYNQNNLFAKNAQQLFTLNIEKYFLEREIELRMIPVGNFKQGIATLISSPKQSSKSYIGLTKYIGNSTKFIVCETGANQATILKKITTLSLSKIECPSNYQVVKFSSEEISKLKSELSEFSTDIQKYQQVISEINRPQKISTLVEAEQLVRKGNYSEALRKYQQSLSVISNKYFNLDYLDILIIGEDATDTEFSPVIISFRDAFFNKIQPIIAKAEPIINRDYQQIKQEMSEFIAKYQSDKNDTAKKVFQISLSQLGLNIQSRVDSKTSISIPEAKIKESRQTTALLRDYFNQLEAKPEKINQKLPRNIRKYLAKKQSAIADLNNVLATGQISVWDIDYNIIKRGDPSEPVPGFLNYRNLQNILLVDAIEKYQKGKIQEVLQSLEASWRINQSLQKQPLLISQLVSIIGYRRQLQIMRQLDNLPAKWAQRLISLNSNVSMMNALKSEAFFQFSLLSQDKLFSQTSLAKNQSTRRWLAVENYRLTNEIYSLVNREKNNVCNLNFVKLTENYLQEKGYDKMSQYPAFLRQLEKAYDVMLQAEMTHKVLQIKNNNNKSLNGNMNSSICPDRKWVYQNLPNRKWSLSLDKQPVWKSKSPKLPLTYVSR
ncbi:MAG: type IV pilin-like G/H family protein [Mastigocoleus sp.]